MATRHSYAGSSQQFNGSREGQQAGQQGQSGMMGQAMEGMRSALEPVQSQAQHVVEEYPLSTVLAVFGIGLGVGVVLGSALIPSSSSSYSSSSWNPFHSSSSSSWNPLHSSSSSWFPSMSSGSSSWMPSSSNGSWFGGHNNASNWTDSMMRSAKQMCGY